MNKLEWAGRIALAAKAMITISIFLVMTWWGASLVLFSICLVLYCVASWMQGDAQEASEAKPENELLTPFPVRQ